MYDFDCVARLASNRTKTACMANKETDMKIPIFLTTALVAILLTLNPTNAGATGAATTTPTVAAELHLPLVFADADQLLESNYLLSVCNSPAGGLPYMKGASQAFKDAKADRSLLGFPGNGTTQLQNCVARYEPRSKKLTEAFTKVITATQAGCKQVEDKAMIDKAKADLETAKAETAKAKEIEEKAKALEEKLAKAKKKAKPGIEKEIEDLGYIPGSLEDATDVETKAKAKVDAFAKSKPMIWDCGSKDIALAKSVLELYSSAPEVKAKEAKEYCESISPTPTPDQKVEDRLLLSAACYVALGAASFDTYQPPSDYTQLTALNAETAGDIEAGRTVIVSKRFVAPAAHKVKTANKDKIEFTGGGSMTASDVNNSSTMVFLSPPAPEAYVPSGEGVGYGVDLSSTIGVIDEGHIEGSSLHLVKFVISYTHNLGRVPIEVALNAGFANVQGLHTGASEDDGNRFTPVGGLTLKSGWDFGTLAVLAVLDLYAIPLGIAPGLDFKIDLESVSLLVGTRLNFFNTNISAGSRWGEQIEDIKVNGPSINIGVRL